MSDNRMRILVVEPTKDPYVKEIDGSLASMQAIVGGFIQAVEPFDDHNVLLLCNEEAKLLGLPENRFLRDSAMAVRMILSTARSSSPKAAVRNFVL